MTDKESAIRSKWQSSGVKIKQVVRLQSIDDPGGGGGTLSINRKVNKRNYCCTFANNSTHSLNEQR